MQDDAPGMMTMTPMTAIEFEQDDGPGFEVEQVSKVKVIEKNTAAMS